MATKVKNPHAVALGLLGGRKGGLVKVPKGFALSGKASMAGKKGAKARWGKKAKTRKG
jgi:hypothetical protein